MLPCLSNDNTDKHIQDDASKQNSAFQEMQRCRMLIETIHAEIGALKSSTSDLSSKVSQHALELHHILQLHRSSTPEMLTVEGPSAQAHYSDPIDRWIAAFVLMNPYSGVNIVKNTDGSYLVDERQIVYMNLSEGDIEPMISYSSNTKGSIPFSYFFRLTSPSLPFQTTSPPRNSIPKDISPSTSHPPSPISDFQLLNEETMKKTQTEKRNSQSSPTSQKTFSARKNVNLPRSTSKKALKSQPTLVDSPSVRHSQFVASESQKYKLMTLIDNSPGKAQKTENSAQNILSARYNPSLLDNIPQHLLGNSSFRSLDQRHQTPHSRSSPIASQRFHPQVSQRINYQPLQEYLQISSRDQSHPQVRPVTFLPPSRDKNNPIPPIVPQHSRLLSGSSSVYGGAFLNKQSSFSAFEAFQKLGVHGGQGPLICTGELSDNDVVMGGVNGAVFSPQPSTQVDRQEFTFGIGYGGSGSETGGYTYPLSETTIQHLNQDESFSNERQRRLSSTGGHYMGLQNRYTFSNNFVPVPENDFCQNFVRTSSSSHGAHPSSFNPDDPRMLDSPNSFATVPRMPTSTFEPFSPGSSSHHFFPEPYSNSNPDVFQRQSTSPMLSIAPPTNPFSHLFSSRERETPVFNSSFPFNTRGSTASVIDYAAEQTPKSHKGDQTFPVTKLVKAKPNSPKPSKIQDSGKKVSKNKKRSESLPASPKNSVKQSQIVPTPKSVAKSTTEQKKPSSPKSISVPMKEKQSSVKSTSSAIPKKKLVKRANSQSRLQ